MKKLIFAFIPWLFTAFSYKAMAQDDKSTGDKKETQEIIIRKKGDKDVTLNIKITDDKVIVNGKPLVEFSDDGVTVNKRKIIIRDGDSFAFGEGFKALENMGDFNWSGVNEEPGALLGVTTEKNDKGARIMEVNEESAAAKAGLKKDDIITKLADTKIDGPETLYKTVTAKKPADEVKVYYIRDGKEKSTKAVLQERKSSARVFSFNTPEGSTKTITIPPAESFRNYTDMYRRNMDNMPGDYNYSFPRQKKLGLKIQDTEKGNGVTVLEVEDSSASALAGLKKDDIITEIAGTKVTNTDEVREQLMENKDKSTYSIKANRGNKEMNFEIKIPKKLKTANL